MITTVLNERDNIEQFVDSLKLQTKRPDEIIVLDGGSIDGTISYLRGIPEVTLCVDNGCNIKHLASPVAHGRNLAIAIAHGDIIAVTDAGCRLHPRWLEELTGPLVSDQVDVVGGRTELWLRTPITALSWLIWGQNKPLELGQASSRSIAFKRKIWGDVGGYPEIALTAEDTLFNAKLKRHGAKYAYAKDAVVYWTPPATVTSLVRQSYRYAKGDAICGTQWRMYGMKVLKFGLFVILLAFVVDGARIAGFVVGLLKKLGGATW